MKKNNTIQIWIAEIVIFVIMLGNVAPLHAARIKDITDVVGVRSNELIGYGLVVGLSGTGDKTGTLFTIQSLASMLTRMGITADPLKTKVKNVAAVMVTARLPPFVKAGTRLDITLSSLGDAQTLQGGTLLLTPLKGPDQVVYAVAQGAISVGGFIGGDSGGSTIQKNHTTVGRIPNGATVEREVPTQFAQKETIQLILREPDFTTSVRMAEAINKGLKDISNKSDETARPAFAHADDSAVVSVAVPAVYQGRLAEFLSRVERFEVPIDFPAKVIVNERAGTIVMGAQVRLSEVAVAHGNLTIEVKKKKEVSQPEPLSTGQTTTTENTDVEITEEPATMLVLKGGPTIGTLVKGLNALGVSPRDLITILQTIKAAGAMQADLEII